MSASLRVNGETIPFEPVTIEQLLRAHAIDPAARGLAVAVNGAVVVRGEWPAKPLAPGDDIEIIRALAGG